MKKTTNNIKATATANVLNGVASTNNITYSQQLVAGQTYTINAEYVQNDQYMSERGVGTLEIQRIPTTLAISGNTSITIGESVTLTVTAKDSSDNTITRGVVNVYDGDEIIQSNYAIAGHSTNIVFIPSTVGVHDIYAVYSDTNSEYNNSTSNHLSITVNKLSSSITTTSNSISAYYDDTVTITGTLNCSGGTVSNQTIKLLDYDNAVKQTVSTNNNGEFTLTYYCNSWNVNGNNITISYEGTNTQNNSTKTIPVTLSRHNVTLTVADVTGYTDDSVEIVINAVDESGNPVDSGNVTVDITQIPQLIMKINGDSFSTYSSTPFTFTGPLTIDYGDGTTETITENQQLNHTYSSSRTYSITIQGNITSLGNACFYECSGLTSVTIPSSVTSLGSNCFFRCTGLTSVTIPSSVTSLGSNCFNGCSGLTSVTIPSSVTSLRGNCFNGCSGLTSVTIPSSVTSLEGGCFQNCSGLTSVTIPSSVTSFGFGCFNGCSGLTYIAFEWNTSDTILTYQDNWDVPSTTEIHIPTGTTSLYVAKEYPSDRLVEVQ